MTARSRSAAHRRRARWTLLWAAAVVVLVQLVAGALLDSIGLAIRFPSAARILTRAATEPRAPAVICLGSSRFIHGLPEAALQEALASAIDSPGTASVLNAAVPAGDPVSSEFVLRELLRTGIRPRLVVVELTPEAVNQCNTWLSIHVQRQLGWADVPAYARDLWVARQFVRLLRARLVPLYVHRQELRRYAINGLGRLTGGGGRADDGAPLLPRPGPVEDLMTTLQRSGLPPAEYTPHGAGLVAGWIRHYAVGGTVAAALDRLLQQCRANAIAVLLVSPPVTAAHRNAYPAAVEAAFQTHVRRLVATYDCQFVDCRDRLPDESFIDNHHLRPEGGRQFSAMLGPEIATALRRRP